MDNNLNDIDLIAGSDSPFDPWVRDAVRNLRDENAALKAEIALMHGADDYDDITEYEYMLRGASPASSPIQFSGPEQEREWLAVIDERVRAMFMRRRKPGTWERF